MTAARNITLRADSDAGLTDQQIRAFAPAVFQTQPRQDMSQRYQFVPTYELVAEMRSQGLVPTEVQVYHRHVEAYRPYAMHLLRFSLPGAKGKLKQVGDSVPQVVVRNSHDGSANLEFFNGMFRLACSNGLIVSDTSTVHAVKVRHASNPVLAAMFEVHDLIERQVEVMEHIEQMRKTRLTPEQQRAFGQQALSLHASRSAIDPAEVLRARRPDDQGDDVWRVFNRAQENIVRGGMRGITATGRNTVSRGSDTLYRQLDVNAALWTLAMTAIGKAASTSAQQVAAQAA